MQCGISLAMDDIINGNMTADQSSFFIGTATIVNRLADLSGNATTIINDLTGNLSTDVGHIKNNYSQAQTDLDMLPNGTTANTTFTLNYADPLTGVGNPYPSGFGTVLGTANNDSTLAGALYQIVSGVGGAMNTLDDALTALSGASGTIVGNIGAAKDQVQTFSDLFVNVDNSVGGIFSTLNEFNPYIKTAFLGFFGAVLGLAVIALLGVIIMACFNKVGCRYLMYFSCVLMTVITILGSLLSFILSFLMPILFLACTVINTGIDTSSSFSSTLYFKRRHEHDFGIGPQPDGPHFDLPSRRQWPDPVFAGVCVGYHQQQPRKHQHLYEHDQHVRLV
jgi:hypothetical protein